MPSGPDYLKTSRIGLKTLMQQIYFMAVSAFNYNVESVNNSDSRSNFIFSLFLASGFPQSLLII